MEKLTELKIQKCIIAYLLNKTDGNWHEDKVRKTNLHAHGPDLVLIGGKRNSEHFIIECKGTAMDSEPIRSFLFGKEF